MSLSVLKPIDEQVYYIAVGMINGIGFNNAKQLISYCGGPKKVFYSSKNRLLKIPGLGPSTVASILQINKELLFKRAQIEWENCKKNGIKIIHYNDPQYPQRLLHCKDAPYLLFVKGNADLNRRRMISIVGTRRITDYGKEMVAEIVNELNGYGISVVSGLAYGVDGYVHRHCLDKKIPTIGVLAHGLDIIYPAVHKKMANEMFEDGALISEFKFGTKPDRQNFPSRNRIVAGMCDATVVVESAAKGGALITAEIANGYHRDVFAVPGRARDKYSEGCNMLIRNNIAALISSGKDIVESLGWGVEEAIAKPNNIQKRLFLELSDSEKIVYDYLEKVSAKVHIDQLNRMLNIPMSTIVSALLSMELNGLLLSTPGNCYKLA